MVIEFDIAFDEGNESYKTSLKLLELDEEVVAALGQDLEAQFVSNSASLNVSTSNWRSRYCIGGGVVHANRNIQFDQS